MMEMKIVKNPDLPSFLITTPNQYVLLPGRHLVSYHDLTTIFQDIENYLYILIAFLCHTYKIIEFLSSLIFISNLIFSKETNSTYFHQNIPQKYIRYLSVCKVCPIKFSFINSVQNILIIIIKLGVEMPRTSARVRTQTAKMQEAQKMKAMPKRQLGLKIKKEQKKQSFEGKSQKRRNFKKQTENREDGQESQKEMILEPLIDHPSEQIMGEQKPLWDSNAVVELIEYDENSNTVVKSLFDELLETEFLFFN